MSRTRNLAFTMIEMLVVVLIIGVLAAIVIQNLPHRVEDARDKATRLQISNLKTTLSTFYLDNSRYPTTEEGLDPLITCPADLTSSWKGPYMDEVPLDGWGRPFFYRIPSGSTPPFLLASLGADGEENTADDINNLPAPR